MAFLLENAGSPPSAKGSCRLTLLLYDNKRLLSDKENYLVHRYYFLYIIFLVSSIFTTLKWLIILLVQPLQTDFQNSTLCAMIAPTLCYFQEHSYYCSGPQVMIVFIVD